MIELIQLHNPLIIPGNPVPKGNTTIDYRLKNVPAERIKNLGMRQKKQRWDEMLRYQTKVAHAFKTYAAKFGWKKPDKAAQIAIAIEYRFECTKYKNPAFVKKDLDNTQKLVSDSIEDSGIIDNDKQICMMLLTKEATEKGSGAIVVHSFAVVTEFNEWLENLKNNEQRKRL